MAKFIDWVKNSGFVLKFKLNPVQWDWIPYFGKSHSEATLLLTPSYRGVYGGWLFVGFHLFIGNGDTDDWIEEIEAKDDD